MPRNCSPRQGPFSVLSRSEQDPRARRLQHRVLLASPLHPSYKATQKSTGKLVAIKVCLEKNYHYIQHEIELQSQSHHPCILTIYECFRWKEHIYVRLTLSRHTQIVIEYMDRGSLTEIISPRYPLPEQHIAYVCRCLLLALDALHSKNRIHRGVGRSAQ